MIQTKHFDVVYISVGLFIASVLLCFKQMAAKYAGSRASSNYGDRRNICGDDEVNTPRRNPLGNSVNSLLQPDLHDSYRSPRPAPRVGTSAVAAAILLRSRGDDVSSCFQHNQQRESNQRTDGTTVGCGILPVDSAPASNILIPRVVGQLASDILQRHDGSTMALTMNVDQNRNYESPRPRARLPVGGTGEIIAEKHSGSSMERVLNADANKGYSSARPRPRIRDGDFAIRSSGVAMSAALDHAGNQDYWSAREPRVKGEVSEEILLRGKVGTVGRVLNAEENREYMSPRPKQRLTGSQAVTNAQHGRGALVPRVLDAANNIDYQSPRPAPKVRSDEGKAIATHGERGTMSKVLNEDRSRSDTTPRAASRIKPEALSNAVAGQRGTYGMALEGRLPATPPGGVRVSDAAYEIYERGTRGTLGGMMADYGRLPLSSRPASRIRDDGGPIAERGQSGTVQNLFSQYGELPLSARPEPRIRPEAKRNAVRNKGTMSEFFS